MLLWDQLQEDYIRYALVSAAAVGLVCSLLSVVVVLKRMAFIGQGISHAGFGGLGVAMVLGVTAGSMAEYAVVLVFCLATAIGIGALVRSGKVEVDTAIGVLLVFSMAFGVALVHLRLQLESWQPYYDWVGGPMYTVPWEQLLFGSPLMAGKQGMWWSLGMSGGVLAVCALVFKELVYFAFDEPAARVSGVRSGLIYYLMLSMLALVVVVGMRLVGFLLVSALLMMPGATALMLSRRLGPVLVMSAGVGLIGCLGGMVLSLRVGQLSPGASIVLVLFVLFLTGGLVSRLRGAAA